MFLSRCRYICLAGICWRFYDRHEITFKKTLHAAEQDRPDVAAARVALKAEQPSLKAPRLVFIDETAVTTKMVRHYGRSPRGERLVASVPHGHWKTLTFIAALRFDGMTAPYVIAHSPTRAGLRVTVVAPARPAVGLVTMSAKSSEAQSPQTSRSSSRSSSNLCSI